MLNIDPENILQQMRNVGAVLTAFSEKMEEAASSFDPAKDEQGQLFTGSFVVQAEAEEDQAMYERLITSLLNRWELPHRWLDTEINGTMYREIKFSVPAFKLVEVLN